MLSIEIKTVIKSFLSIGFKGLMVIVMLIAAEPIKVGASTELSLTKVLEDTLKGNGGGIRFQLDDKTIVMSNGYSIFSSIVIYDKNGGFKKKLQGHYNDMKKMGNNSFATISMYEDKWELVIYDASGDTKFIGAVGSKSGTTSINTLDNGNILVVSNSSKTMEVYTPEGVKVKEKSYDETSGIQMPVHPGITTGKGNFLMYGYPSGGSGLDHVARLFDNNLNILKTTEDYISSVKYETLADGRYVRGVQNSYGNYLLHDKNFNVVNADDYEMNDRFKVIFTHGGQMKHNLNQITNGNHILGTSMYDKDMRLLRTIPGMSGFFETNISGGRFVTLYSLDGTRKIQVYNNDGASLMEFNIDLGGEIYYVFELSNGNLFIGGSVNYAIYKIVGGSNENDGNDGNDGVVGDATKAVSAIIFLPEGGNVPSGFSGKGGNVYQKEDSGFTITAYIIRYTPPATIGNINIQ